MAGPFNKEMEVANRKDCTTVKVIQDHVILEQLVNILGVPKHIILSKKESRQNSVLRAR